MIPSDSQLFSVKGNCITLKEEGLYEVTLNVCYAQSHGMEGEVALLLNSQQLPCARRKLNCADYGVLLSHTLYAAAGDVLSVSLSGTRGYKDLAALISVKSFGTPD